jgi:hypothetical protein
MDPIINKIGNELNLTSTELGQFYIEIAYKPKIVFVTEPEHSRRYPTFYRNYLIALTHRDTGRCHKLTILVKE